MKTDLLKFTIKLSKGKVYDVDFGKMLKIDTNLTEELLNQQSSKFAWISTLFQLARALEQERKQNLDLVEAKLDLKFRRELPDDLKGTRPTEAMLKSLITSHSLYQAALTAYQEARFQASVLSEARDAMRDRRDTLISANANLRQEYNGAL